VTDAQRDICRLIDFETNEIVEKYDYSAFGEKLQSEETIKNPWQFASKRFDPNLRLIYFGKRDYDPSIGRWLTQDPLGFEDSFNPYQYVYNNPFRYFDPHGESVGGFLCGLGSMALGSGIIMTGGMLEIATFGGYTIAFGVHLNVGTALIATGIGMTAYNMPDIPLPSTLNFPATSSQQYETYGLITLPTVEHHVSPSTTRIDKKDKQEGKKKKQRNARPDPDPKAEGSERSKIEKPGSDGQYTTHYDNGSNWKQYRGSGKAHGEVARPNVKETCTNTDSNGRSYIKTRVRKARPNEIPQKK
jgi:RHS repeat-associated protein